LIALSLLQLIVLRLMKVMEVNSKHLLATSICNIQIILILTFLVRCNASVLNNLTQLVIATNQFITRPTALRMLMVTKRVPLFAKHTLK